MPQPAEVHALADRTVQAYIDGWVRIQKELTRLADDPLRMAATRRLRAMQATIESIVDGRDDDAAVDFVSNVLPKVYAAGAAAGAPQGAGDFVWEQIHQQAVQTLAQSTWSDLLNATQGVRDSTKQLIRTVAKDQALQAAVTGQTSQQAAREMRRILRESGVSAVTYADGSRHGLGEYAEMTQRTKSAVGYNIGTLNAAAPTQFFEIFDGPDCGLSFHEDPTLANGLIVDRDTSFKYVIAHPNCRRAFGPRPDILSADQAHRTPPSVTEEQVAAQRAADRLRAERGQRRAQNGADRRAARLQSRAERVGSPQPVDEGSQLLSAAQSAEDRLQAGVDSGIEKVEHLGSGSQRGADKVTFADGTVAVRKGYRDTDLADSDVLAHRLAARAGVDAPAQIRTGPTTTFTEFVEGKTGGKFVQASKLENRDALRELFYTEEGQRIGVLDRVAGNGDRNPGNWIVRDGKPVPIDMDSAFDPRFEIDFDDAFSRAWDNPAGQWVEAKDAYSFTDVKVARQTRDALSRMKDDFIELGHEDWWEAAMHRADDLIRRAQAADTSPEQVQKAFRHARATDEEVAVLKAKIDGLRSGVPVEPPPAPEFKILDAEHTGLGKTEYRFLADPDQRFTAMYQYDYESLNLMRAVSRNLDRGVDPWDGVEIPDLLLRKQKSTLDDLNLFRDGYNLPAQTYTEADLKADFEAGAKWLNGKLANPADAPTLHRGMVVDGDPLKLFKVGDTIDLDRVSFTENFDESLMYALRDERHRPGTDGVLIELRDAKGFKISEFSSGKMSESKEWLASGKMEITKVSKAEGEHVRVEARLVESKRGTGPAPTPVPGLGGGRAAELRQLIAEQEAALKRAPGGGARARIKRKLEPLRDELAALEKVEPPKVEPPVAPPPPKPKPVEPPKVEPLAPTKFGDFRDDLPNLDDVPSLEQIRKDHFGWTNKVAEKERQRLIALKVPTNEEIRKAHPGWTSARADKQLAQIREHLGLSPETPPTVIPVRVVPKKPAVPTVVPKEPTPAPTQPGGKFLSGKIQDRIDQVRVKYESELHLEQDAGTVKPTLNTAGALELMAEKDPDWGEHWKTDGGGIFSSTGRVKTNIPISRQALQDAIEDFIERNGDDPFYESFLDGVEKSAPGWIKSRGADVSKDGIEKMLTKDNLAWGPNTTDRVFGTQAGRKAAEERVGGQVSKATKWYQTHMDGSVAASWANGARSRAGSAVIRENKTGRAFFQYAGPLFKGGGASKDTISLGKGGQARVAVHEMGHYFEYHAGDTFDGASASSSVQRDAAAFRDYRGAKSGKEATAIYHGSDEYGYEDEFLSHYMGKIYSGRSSTEIVSMGFEELYADPVKLYTRDPEYFWFMVGLLKGDLVA